MLTDDENIIDIQFAVQYNLKNAEDYVFNNRKPDHIVAYVAETRDPRGRRQEQDGFRALRRPRADRASRPSKLMQQMLDRYETGVFVQKVTLQSVQPPDKVQAAFDDAVKAGQDRERLINEGQAYANDVVPRARGMAARLMEEANGYASEVVQRAEGDASRFRQILGRVREGARGHARAPVPRHDAVGARQLEQGACRPEGRPEPALPAARQADPADRRRGRRPGRGDRADLPATARRAAPAPDGSTSSGSIHRARAMRCATARDADDEGHHADPRAVVALLLVASQSIYTVDQRKYAIKFQLGEIVETHTKAGLYSKVPLMQNVKFYDKRHPDARQPRARPHHDVREEAAAGRLLRALADHRRQAVLRHRCRATRRPRAGGSRRRSAPTCARNSTSARRARGDLDRARQDHDGSPGRRPMPTPRRSASRSSTCACAASSCRPTSPARSTSGWNRSAAASPTSCARPGQAESEKIRADADRQREVILADAYRQAQKIKGEGDAKASAIYAQAYGANPEFYAFYRSLEAYKATFHNKSDVMVLDPSAEFFRTSRAGIGRRRAKAAEVAPRIDARGIDGVADSLWTALRAGAGDRGHAAVRRAAPVARRFRGSSELTDGQLRFIGLAFDRASASSLLWRCRNA